MAGFGEAHPESLAADFRGRDRLFKCSGGFRTEIKAFLIIRLHVVTSVAQHIADTFHEGGGTAAKYLAFLEVGQHQRQHLNVETTGITAPAMMGGGVTAGEGKFQPRVLGSQKRQFLTENDVRRGACGMDETQIRRFGQIAGGACHRHHRRDAAACRNEQKLFLAGGVGGEFTKRAGNIHFLARHHIIMQPVRTGAARDAFDRDFDPVGACRRPRDCITARDHAFDRQFKRHVLTRIKAKRTGFAGRKDECLYVMGFLTHLSTDQNVILFRVPKRDAGGLGKVFIVPGRGGLPGCRWIGLGHHMATAPDLSLARCCFIRAIYQSQNASTCGSVKRE